MTHDTHRERLLDTEDYAAIIENYDKIALFVDESLDQSFYDMTTSEIISALELDKNSVILDLGSCHGDQIADYVSLGAEVHAFEPNPIHVNAIKERFSNYQNLIFHYHH